jgi:hypothetical protein
MADPADRFLRHTVISNRGSLGRNFGVSRESWRLTDDPKRTRPKVERLLSQSSASDAADLARAAAEAFARHGFHKPSGAWWGADEGFFHRFVVQRDRSPKPAALLLASGILGVGIALLARRRRRPA